LVQGCITALVYALVQCENKKVIFTGKITKRKEKMKKRNLLLVVLALALVFGMMVSCGPEEDWGDNGGNGDGDGDWEFDESFLGTYKATYGDKNITETIVFEIDSFRISDDSKTGEVLNDDFLEFDIEEFDEVTTIPNEVKDTYSEGFIFKGYITAAKPVTTTGTYAPNLYGNQTGPGLTQDDIDNKTLLKMYIFYDPDTGDFVRTAFVKNSGSIGNIIRVSTTPANAALRIYSREE
jgi:hypothetical protein